MKVEILLATYRSSNYLTEQIDSILAQDYEDWSLTVRDGGSDDKTLEILESYRNQYPERIRILNNHVRSSALENFTELLKQSTADYIMFADHDDVWLPDKVSCSIHELKRIEKRADDTKPLLLFTDKKVVDEQLNEIDSSYFHYAHLNPQAIGLNRLLVQNVPSGCTMLFNRALADLCTPIPEDAVMHDHWVALTACVFGQIHFLDRQTILYRQHSQNVYGAVKHSWQYFANKVQNGFDQAKDRFMQNVKQADCFLQTFHDRLSVSDRNMLQAFGSFDVRSYWMKRWILWKYRILKTGFRRNLGMFVIV